MLTKFSEYIVKRMGILTSLGKIADELLELFKKSKKFTFETEIENIPIILKCEYKKIGNHDGQTTHLYDNVFSFIISDINRSIIIHELKHVHYDRVTKGSDDKYNLVSHISRSILDYKFKYINKTPETLYDIFYYTNPNEFEAYFNSMYEELLERTKNKSKRVKREIITNFLNDTELFMIYDFYYKNEFDITDYFYNNTFLSEYLDEYIRILTDFKNDGETMIDNNNFLKSQFKKLIEIFKQPKELTIDQKKTLNDINKAINKTVKKNYKKLFRLYTLILDDINESNSRWYRNYEIIKNPLKTAGEDGLWSIPELYWMKYGNKIQKGFETISIIQSKEAIDKWFDFSEKTKKIYETSYNDVLKYQQIGDPSSDILFSSENSEFLEETIHITKLRELNNMSNEETDDGYEQTLSYFKELGLDEDESITRRLFKKIVDGIELSSIVVDENYKLLDGFHRLAVYSELYFYHGYDFDFDGKLKIYKRI